MKFGGFIEQPTSSKPTLLRSRGIIPAQLDAGRTGNAYGDLLVGRPALFTQATKIPTGHFRFYDYEAYAQDSWKIRSNLTLEYGLRFAYFPNNFERDRLGVLFDPNGYDRSQGPLINGDPNRPNGFLLASKGEIQRHNPHSSGSMGAPPQLRVGH